ncbi:hypothetical protein ACFVAD_23525 [Sutcliffiella sp. NPDC057660]|uniref:hypothetical protein n=1 Tax=Sutcliffiella sp. NPDC057660 TaxID=3346199 RepID=UPI003683F221
MVEKSFIEVMKDFFVVRQVQKVHHKADEGPFHEKQVQKVHHKADEEPFHGKAGAKGPS